MHEFLDQREPEQKEVIESWGKKYGVNGSQPSVKNIPLRAGHMHNGGYRECPQPPPPGSAVRLSAQLSLSMSLIRPNYYKIELWHGVEE